MWSVYLLECKNGALYAGVTNDLSARVKVHNAGKGGAFTRAFRPCTLVWHEHHPNRSDAQKREAEIKNWRREKKSKFIKENPSPCSGCSKL